MPVLALYLKRNNSPQVNVANQLKLSEKCPYSELFWSLFSRIPQSRVQMR